MTARRATLSALALLSHRPWAILPNVLEAMVAAARGEGALRAGVQALEAEQGEPLERAWGVTVREGVARIRVEGPLFMSSGFDCWLWGGSSYERIARDLNEALRDPSVRSVVLDVNSPGGEVFGCDELAGMIRAAREVKPLTAYVSGQACSAAYWLASACDEVIAAPTSVLGSIGSCISYLDVSGWLEKEGIRRIQIVSSQSPRKNRDPATKEGRSDVQEMLDAIAEVFIATVAVNREVSPEKVLERYGQGGVLVGAAAVSAGLADALGNYEQVLRELAAADAESVVAGGAVAATGVRQVASATAGRGGRTGRPQHTPAKGARHGQA